MPAVALACSVRVPLPLTPPETVNRFVPVAEVLHVCVLPRTMGALMPMGPLPAAIVMPLPALAPIVSGVVAVPAMLIADEVRALKVRLLIEKACPRVVDRLPAVEVDVKNTLVLVPGKPGCECCRPGSHPSAWTSRIPVRIHRTGPVSSR